MRWLRGRASEIAHHEEDASTRFAVATHEWLRDDGVWRSYLALLTSGQPVVYADTTDDAVFEFSARPVLLALDTASTRQEGDTP